MHPLWEVFEQKCTLVDNQRIHTRNKQYQCIHCENSFTRRESDKSPENTHWSETLSMHPLWEVFCTEKYSSRSSENTHWGKTYQCTHCEKSLALKVNLVKHQEIHTGEKPYHCTHCGKSFAQKNTLVNDQGTHTGEKHINASTVRTLLPWKLLW